MPPKKQSNSGLGPRNCQGFILLEVLVAMSIILGVWMASVGVYQRLALNLVQQEAKRSQLRKESDVHETQQQVKANSYLSGKNLINEPARMSSRNRSVRTTTQSVAKNQR
ncbi:prepilin-type N-terminal cleavage/methylation domain-containing protein [Polynucleobacter sp. UK-Gri1-W3]|uniref:type II secretion system protein n=1 Tax=Polynucleobacter sp. UK-Gri1-W3 TaxID=1819737 RepID=UPI001C0C3C90|nr:prepilin-type N-terminal cleavage/methylation domain-containing protein [Polynucleobacter sp. UK-Gri1-W3]